MGHPPRGLTQHPSRPCLGNAACCIHGKVKILFEETTFNAAEESYRMVCIDGPLSGGTKQHCLLSCVTPIPLAPAFASPLPPANAR